MLANWKELKGTSTLQVGIFYPNRQSLPYRHSRKALNPLPSFTGPTSRVILSITIHRQLALLNHPCNTVCYNTLLQSIPSCSFFTIWGTYECTENLDCAPNSYVHYAFVYLSSIGAVDSGPWSKLEDGRCKHQPLPFKTQPQYRFPFSLLS